MMDSDCCMERTVTCSTISLEAVRAWLSDGTKHKGKELVLVDIRGRTAFHASRVKTAVNLRLSNLLLRRIYRGTTTVENVCPEAIKEQIECRKRPDVAVVLYDECSRSDKVQKDIYLYTEILQSASANDVAFLNGGFAKFSSTCCHFCEGTDVQIPVKKMSSLSFPLREHQEHQALKQCSTQSYKDEILARPPSEILPFLYIGSAENSSDEDLLKELGVTAILNVSYNSPQHFETAFDYKKITVMDDHHADLLSELSTAIEFIDSVKQRGGCTLVHCVAGISRSATVCIAYLMKHLCWELQRAFDFLKTKRSCIAPNLSFMGQLLAFEKQLNLQPAKKLFLHLKEERSSAHCGGILLKRCSPTSEEARLLTKASKSDSDISPRSSNKFKEFNRSVKSFPDNRQRPLVLPLKLLSITHCEKSKPVAIDS